MALLLGDALCLGRVQNPHLVSCQDPRGPLLSRCLIYFSLRRANYMSFLLPLNPPLMPSCLLPLVSSIPLACHWQMPHPSQLSRKVTSVRVSRSSGLCSL